MLVKSYSRFMLGISKAQKYFVTMHEAVNAPIKNIDLGSDASECIVDLKRFSCKAHITFYLHTTSGIFIIRVLSQFMGYEQNL